MRCCQEWQKLCDGAEDLLQRPEGAEKPPLHEVLLTLPGWKCYKASFVGPESWNVATTEYTVEVCWRNSFSNIDDWWPCWFSWGGGHHPKVAWLWGQTFPLLATTSHTMKVCWSRCQPLRIWAMAFHSDQVRMAKAKAKDVAMCTMAMAKASINERKSLVQWPFGTSIFCGRLIASPRPWLPCPPSWSPWPALSPLPHRCQLTSMTTEWFLLTNNHRKSIVINQNIHPFWVNLPFLYIFVKMLLKIRETVKHCSHLAQGFLSNRNLVTGRGATITMNTNHREKKYQGDEDNTSLASWAVISDKDAAVSDHADWFMVDESTESMELMEHDMPEKTLDSLVGPLRINGIDFSQISFLLGEWIDSLGHSVSVVATGGCSARARISWDHKGQKKTQLWKTFLKALWRKIDLHLIYIWIYRWFDMWFDAQIICLF